MSRPFSARCATAGRLAVVVGGTGLYFKALTEGLAAIPDIPYAVRTRLAEEAEGTPSAALHARLAEVDPEGAAVIRETDRSRILRALEVFEATGRPLARWQAAEPLPPLIEAAMAVRVVIGPERSELHRRIGERAEAMVHAGALAEVEALARRALDPALPAMKAIGVRPLLDHIAGRHLAGRGDRLDQDRNPPLRQAPGDVVPAPDFGLAAAGPVERGEGELEGGMGCRVRERHPIHASGGGRDRPALGRPVGLGDVLEGGGVRTSMTLT